MVEEQTYLVPVRCQEVYVISCFKHKSQNMENNQLQVRPASMQYDKRSITKSINVLDVVLKFVWVYTGKSLSKSLKCH